MTSNYQKDRIIHRDQWDGHVKRLLINMPMACSREIESKMNANSIHSLITSIQREIQSAQRKLTDKTKDEASKNARIASIQKSITKNISASSLQSKMREIERTQNEIVRIQNAKADATKTISSKTERLHSLQQKLFEAQRKEQESALNKLQRRQDENTNFQQRRLDDLFSRHITEGVIPAEDRAEHDVFISHASEDKHEVVRPLAEFLRSKGFDVWYDEFQLRIGDSLRRSIDAGLANSRFGIVVLSRAFFEKNWPQYELDGLVQKEMRGSKIILPIWHRITKSEVIGYSPSLADKVALNTATATIDEIATQIGDVLRK